MKTRTRSIILFFLFIITSLAGFTQETGSARIYEIRKTSESVRIDGILDENIWQSVQIAGQFIQNYPEDSVPAQSKTEVMLTYDDDYLYVAARCYDDLPGDYVVQSLKRDFSYPKSDAFAVFIDPTGDQINGFSFAVNPLGVQREGLIASGGTFGVTTSWDQKWYSAVHKDSTFWSVEMAIPFKSLRYKKGTPVWRINFSRHDLKRNENSSWVYVPRNFNIASLAFTGMLIWDNPPPEAGANIAIIPSATGGVIKDYSHKSDPDPQWNIGLDGKVGITSSLNLDITVNPDFAQVEVDRQITDLDRFDLFYPEQREFFIENSDLFAQFGFRRIRPFFSRKIGLYKGEEVPILGGLRLSGKVNQDWRIGIMSIQTEGVGHLHLKSQNYSVGAFQWQAFGRTELAGIVVHRQAFTGYQPDRDDFNTVAGIDLNINSKNNLWKGKLFYHHSFTSTSLPDMGATALWLQYDAEHWFVMWNHEYVGENYTAETGFVPRHGYIRLEPMISPKFYPSKGKINNHAPALYADIYFDKSLNATDWEFEFFYRINFENQSSFEASYSELFVKLTEPFDASGTGGTPLPEGDYYFRKGSVEYTSDFRKPFQIFQEVAYGSYYNGYRATITTELACRAQPWGVFSLAWEQNEIRLPRPYNDAHLTLIGPKIELSFTRSLFFTTFIQYNNQYENLNINSRLQWRFKPLSDLYIVYTENYKTAPNIIGDNYSAYAVKNRAIMLKLIYWISL